MASRARTLAALCHAPHPSQERFVELTEAEAARLRLAERRIVCAASHADGAGRLGIGVAVLGLALVARACWPQIAALLP